jgi:hypothetical protein
MLHLSNITPCFSHRRHIDLKTKMNVRCMAIFMICMHKNFPCPAFKQKKIEISRESSILLFLIAEI